MYISSSIAECSKLWLVAAVSSWIKVILGRAVVSATFQGSSTLIVSVAVALIFLAENPTLAAEAAIISEIL